MQAKWKKWLSAVGVDVKDGVPVEIDPVYALDAEDLKAFGLELCCCC